jgi:hypothetical protein
MRNTESFFGVSCADPTAMRTTGDGVVRGIVLKWGASSQNDNRDFVEHSRGLLLISCAELLTAREGLDMLSNRLCQPEAGTNFPGLWDAAAKLRACYDSMLDSAGLYLRTAEALSLVARQACESRHIVLATSCLSRIETLHGNAKRLINQIELQQIDSILIESAGQNIAA